MPDMKTAQAGTELNAIDGRTPVRVVGHAAHRCGEACPVTDARRLPVKLLASPQDRRDIGSPVPKADIAACRINDRPSW